MGVWDAGDAGCKEARSSEPPTAPTDEDASPPNGPAPSHRRRGQAQPSAAAATSNGRPTATAASPNGNSAASSGGGRHQREPGGGDDGVIAGDDDEDEYEEEEDDEDGGREPSGLEHLEASAAALEDARMALLRAAERLSAYAQRHAFSAADHAAAAARLDLVERLMRSQRARTSEALLEAVAAARARLEQYYDAEGRRGEWEAEAAVLQAQLLRDSLRLSAARQAAAGQLRVAVEECLGQLAMSGCRFDVRTSWEPAHPGVAPSKCLHIGEEQAHAVGQARGGAYRLRPQGLDTVEFLLAAGPSEPLRPLAAVASGGESARVMLALKAAPAAAAAAASAAAAARSLPAAAGGAADSAKAEASADVQVSNEEEGAPAEEGSFSAEGSTPVLVLDELDSGVGSRLGANVGRLLRRMCAPGGGAVGGGGGHAAAAAASQVLCVTHLPQVAAHAAHHVVVAKTGGIRTETVFEELASPDQRAAEIAAMMGSGGQEAARQLLAEAAAA